MTAIPSRILPALLIGALAGGCSPIAGERTAEDPAREKLLRTIADEAEKDAGENCLLMVWSEEDDPDIAFDRANDAVKGGAVSCATGASPSRFESAISALRDAARSGNKAQILKQVGIPLLYITDDGERRELTEAQIDALFDEVFDDDMLDLLQRLDLSQMTVEKDQGAYFELGSLWLVVDDSGTPRVMTVNRQALGEAALAARDQAQRGGGNELE